MKHMPRTWKVGAVGVLALTGIAGCVAGGYDGEVGVGYVGGVYEPGGRRAAPSIPSGPRGGRDHRDGGKGH